MAFLLAATAGTLLFCWIMANSTATAIATPLNYYLPYYDNSSPNFSADNIVISNLSSNDAPVVVSIAGVDVYSPTVPASSSVIFSSNPETAGGPVKVSSLNGDQLLVSHRYAYADNAGETYAAAEADLDSTYYLSWYDNLTAGASASIELANPDSAAEWAYADVYIGGNFKGEYALQPGGHNSVSYPGVMGGPVKVVTGGQPIIAAERSIFGAGFAEVMGVPQNRLSSHYFFTHYDASTSDYQEWLMAENLNKTDSVYIEMRIGDNVAPIASGIIPAGNNYSYSFPGQNNGPVEVQAWTDSSKSTPANILSSRRYLHGAEFGEETGTPIETISGEYDLSRHDGAPADVTDQTYLANVSTTTSIADVYVGSNPTPAYSASLSAYSMTGPLPADLPSGGPVRVVSRGGNNIIAHQEFEAAGLPIAYFPWYDTIAGSTWLLAAQPAGSGGNLVDFFMKTSPLQQGINVPDGATYPNLYPGQMGGPIKVSSQNNTGISSERSLFGNSFEEVWSTSYDDLDSHYYWPVYLGGLTPEWVLVSNPAENGEPVAVDVAIRHVENANQQPQPDIQVYGHVIQPGDTWTPSWPLIGDAVEVKAYRVGGSPYNPADARKVITSERILVNGAFNEMAGIPASKMTNDYQWTWYDSLNSDDALAIGNPNSGTIYVFVYLHGNLIDSGFVYGGETVAWDSNSGSNPQKLVDGPIEVKACFDASPSCTSPANIFTSQMVFYGPSYEETAGIPAGSFKPTSNWTWYDEQSRGSANWVLVANPNSSPIYYEISIPGQLDPTNPLNPYYSRSHGVLAPGDRVTPDFPGIMGGPVQVKAWTDSSKTTPANVMASQRVLWNGYFNEVVGKGM